MYLFILLLRWPYRRMAVVCCSLTNTRSLSNVDAYILTRRVVQTLVIWLIECGGCIEVIEPWMLREGGEGWEILIALVRFRIVYFRAMSALFHTNIDSFWSLLFQAGSGNQPTRKMNVKNHDRWISRDIVFSDIFGKC